MRGSRVKKKSPASHEEHPPAEEQDHVDHVAFRPCESLQPHLVPVRFGRRSLLKKLLLVGSALPHAHCSMCNAF